VAQPEQLNQALRRLMYGRQLPVQVTVGVSVPPLPLPWSVKVAPDPAGPGPLLLRIVAVTVELCCWTSTPPTGSICWLPPYVHVSSQLWAVDVPVLLTWTTAVNFPAFPCGPAVMV